MGTLQLKPMPHQVSQNRAGRLQLAPGATMDRTP
jgi:hypothetical protein